MVESIYPMWRVYVSVSFLVSSDFPMQSFGKRTHPHAAANPCSVSEDTAVTITYIAFLMPLTRK